MVEFDQDWFYTGPIDYEFKKYSLLGRLKRLQAMLKRNMIWSVITEIEAQLDGLYRFKYEKEVLDDRLKVAKDIDFINFQIIYEVPADASSDQLEVLHRIANEAIVRFEDVYMDARLSWREVEKNIKLTWVPEKKPMLSHGYAALIHDKKTINICHFEKPSRLASDWRTFKFELIDQLPYTKANDLLILRDKYIGEDKSPLFGRLDYSIQIPFEDAVLPICQSIVYSSLIKDFTF